MSDYADFDWIDANGYSPNGKMVQRILASAAQLLDAEGVPEGASKLRAVMRTLPDPGRRPLLNVPQAPMKPS